MNRIGTVVAAIVLVIAVAVITVVVTEVNDPAVPDSMCASAHDEGWTYFETEDTEGFYCEAPNGSVHRTVVHMTGPQYSWEYLTLVGGILGLAIVVGLVATLPKRWAARSK